VTLVDMDAHPDSSFLISPPTSVCKHVLLFPYITFSCSPFKSLSPLILHGKEFNASHINGDMHDYGTERLLHKLAI
jgi:hypothetical protein